MTLLFRTLYAAAILVLALIAIVGIAAIGLYLSFNHKDRDARDYFLAGKSLPWWTIGASLIAANISAEQFIGMSGSGFAIGLDRLAEIVEAQRDVAQP